MDACLDTETVAAWLKAQVDTDTRARIELHGSRCAACRKLLSSLARSQTGTQTSTPRFDHAVEARTRFGRYVFAGEIGAGGMGVVYAAHDPELDRMVAVKLLRGGRDPRLQERLRREAQVMAQLAHPNVVAIHDVGVFEDRMFIAMEYVDGETLARWITRPRSQREILEVYCEAGRGLAAAHAAGIVHRDFKPENVLVGKDGRVRVGDFGLARPAGAPVAPRGTVIDGDCLETAAAAPDASTERAGLTAPGTLLGTRYYMAPELYKGADADARSDQFSFCVALFTALYGERPFDDDEPRAFGAHMRNSRFRDSQIGLRVARRVRAALRRGLAIDPAARFASLDELLAELTPPRARLLRPLIALGVALALGSAIVTWSALHSSAEAADERCTGASAAFAPTWNAERRSAIEAAFTASRVPYAGVTFRQVAAAFDQYSERWKTAYTEACRATRILGEQTEATLELRTKCLERRREEAASLVDALAHADAAVVETSATAAVGLPDVAACSDLATLRQVVELPANPATLSKLSMLMRRQADARAKLATGSVAGALEIARSITEEARTLGYLPFQAEAEFLQGHTEELAGEFAHAEVTLRAAAWSAEASRHDVIAARAWTTLLYVIGQGRDEPERALRDIVPKATAAVARLGGNADIESSLEQALGLIAYGLRDFDAAVGHLQTATTLTARAFGAGHLHVANVLTQLGAALRRQGDPARAVDIEQQALEIATRGLGTDHPMVAPPLQELGNAHVALGSYRLGERELRRAWTIRGRTVAYDLDRAENLIDLACALRHQGKGNEALVLARRAVAIGEKDVGVERPHQLIELALDLAQVGRHDEAFAQLARAEAIYIKNFGPDDVDVVAVQVSYGDVLMLQSRWSDAAARYERALPVLARSRRMADAWTGAVAELGRARVELHQPARSVPPLEDLAGKVESLRPERRVAVEFTLARALWDSGGDRKRARELASHALARVNQLPDAPSDAARPIERWLTSHRPAT